MEGGSNEEGLVTSSLLVNQENASDKFYCLDPNAVGGGSGSGDGGSSPVTAVVIISTAVAVCGSFNTGCAVSRIFLGVGCGVTPPHFPSGLGLSSAPDP